MEGLDRIGRRLRRFGRHEVGLLLALMLVAGALWGFIALADEVVEGETHRIDRMLLLALRNAADPSDPIGPGWVEELGRDMTALGGVGVLMVLSVSVAGYLWLIRKRRAMVLLMVSVGGGLLASSLLKEVFDRPRPDLVPHEAMVYTASFPSGHSMLAAVTYLTLGALLARVEKSWRVKIYLISLAAAVTILVGISRVYLGVHWPSDVLAGWTIGTVWAMAVWTVALALQRRGRAGKEEEPDPS
ncbi:phosphatase PAP2 family protein [Arenibaculum sp.]|jgi:undecaprenyl-diphosphatase|uniref:phosphatase PAP2 family protein n=1 Tax=Arenibaculum sp. TaxID=2865862 RepID=UPI002E0E9F12|nr:phosphatase PAP2 family protein [Arenibaculum sp.]